MGFGTDVLAELGDVGVSELGIGEIDDLEGVCEKGIDSFFIFLRDFHFFQFVFLYFFRSYFK
jgi:hypothetical protein